MKLLAPALALLMCASANAVERIFIGHEQFLPRTAELHPDDSLVIPAGETVVLSDSIDVHTIEVSGTLKIDRLASVFINCVNLVVMEGGTLDCGTEQDPILGALVIQIKNVPIDTDNDPYQWGNGIVCFGNWYSCGFPVPAWSAGSVPTELSGVDGFKSSIQADTFRNVIVQSENPFGTRGHTVVTGHGYCDVRNTAFIGLGRTMNANLNNTTTKDGAFTVGTNQIAKYAFHWHHNHPDNPLNHGVLKNCHFDGNGVNKWGVVIHGTHFVEVSDCIVEKFNGGGIVTEDGNETNNTIHRNLVRGITGNASGTMNDKFNQVAPANNPGAAGSGIWLHGVNNVVTDNVCVECKIGMQAFYRNFSAAALSALAPESPGMTPEKKIDYRTVGPIDMSGNTSVDCQVGFEEWNSPPSLTMDSFAALRNATAGVMMGNGEGGSLSLSNATIIGGERGVSSSAAYTTYISLTDCIIHGCDIGLVEAREYHVIGCKLANKVDCYQELRPYKMRFVDSVLGGTVAIRFKPQDGTKRSYLFWDRFEPMVTATNWQNSGDDLVFVEPYQYSEVQADVSGDDMKYAALFATAMGELQSKYGYSKSGFTCKQSDTITVDRVENAKAFRGEFIYGPHRMVATHGLNQSTPLADGLARVRFNFRYSGPPINNRGTWSAELPGDGASPGTAWIPGLSATVLVDGIKHPAFNNRALPSMAHTFSIERSVMPAAFTHGTHRVELFMSLNGEEIADSRRDYFYHIVKQTTVEPPPPPPPPPPTTDERLTALELQIKQLQALIAQLQALIAKLMGQ